MLILTKSHNTLRHSNPRNNHRVKIVLEGKPGKQGITEPMAITTKNTLKRMGNVTSCPGVFIWNSTNTTPSMKQNTWTLAQSIGKHRYSILPIPIQALLLVSKHVDSTQPGPETPSTGPP